MDQKNEEATLNQKYYEAVHEIIVKYLKRPIEEFDVVCSPGSAKGDNYAGQVFRIEILDKGTKANVMNLFAKVPHENQARREMGSPEIFKREADFYDIVYPMYKNFQALYRIDTEKDGFHQVPFCYKTLTEAPYEGLFFDDLKTSGFLMYDRFKELTRDHVILVMKTLAKMHAVFYAIKDQLPHLVTEFVELKDFFLIMNDRENTPMEPWFDGLKKQVLDLVNRSGNREMVEKINALMKTKFIDLLKEIFDRKNTEPYATLCHGDCWNNNMLFRYDKNGIPDDVRFLDFQIIRYASPVCDLMYYIFSCTTKSLRDKYYQEFLDIYYDELSSYIKRLGSDPEKVFPRDIFENHLKTFGRFGLLMAMMTLPIFTTLSSDVPDLDEMSEKMLKYAEEGKENEIDEDLFSFTTDNNRGVYEERMMGVCDDMLRLGYI